MMKRWIAACAIGILVVFAPSRPQAQVAEALFKCSTSLRVAIACVIFDAGVAKAVEIGWDVVLDLALGKKKTLGPGDYKPSKLKVSEIEADGIEWSKLREFLISVYKSGKPVDADQIKALAKQDCLVNWHPICPHLGIARPREPITDCSKIMTQKDCDTSMFCRWRGSVCAR